MSEPLPDADLQELPEPPRTEADSGAVFLKYLRNGALLFIVAGAVFAAVHFYSLLAQWGN